MPRVEGRKKREIKKKRSHVWSDSVTRARCCSCSTFLPSAEKTHSDPDNLRNSEQVPKHSFGLFSDSMSCVRLSELGQFTIERELKAFFLIGWKDCDTMRGRNQSVTQIFETKASEKISLNKNSLSLMKFLVYSDHFHDRMSDMCSFKSFYSSLCAGETEFGCWTFHIRSCDSLHFYSSTFCTWIFSHILTLLQGSICIS